MMRSPFASSTPPWLRIATIDADQVLVQAHPAGDAVHDQAETLCGHASYSCRIFVVAAPAATWWTSPDGPKWQSRVPLSDLVSRSPSWIASRTLLPCWCRDRDARQERLRFGRRRVAKAVDIMMAVALGMGDAGSSVSRSPRLARSSPWIALRLAGSSSSPASAGPRAPNGSSISRMSGSCTSAPTVPPVAACRRSAATDTAERLEPGQRSNSPRPLADDGARGSRFTSIGSITLERRCATAAAASSGTRCRHRRVALSPAGPRPGFRRSTAAAARRPASAACTCRSRTGRPRRRTRLRDVQIDRPQRGHIAVPRPICLRHAGKRDPGVSPARSDTRRRCAPG